MAVFQQLAHIVTCLLCVLTGVRQQPDLPLLRLPQDLPSAPPNLKSAYVFSYMTKVQLPQDTHTVKDRDRTDMGFSLSWWAPAHAYGPPLFLPTLTYHPSFLPTTTSSWALNSSIRHEDDSFPHTVLPAPTIASNQIPIANH